MAKGRFGGDAYKPQHLGPEPAAPINAAPEFPEPSPPGAIAPVSPAMTDPQSPKAAAPVLPHPALRTRILSDKVPFSSRISPMAQETLARLTARTGRPTTHLLDEALADLFMKYKKELS